MTDTPDSSATQDEIGDDVRRPTRKRHVLGEDLRWDYGRAVPSVAAVAAVFTIALGYSSSLVSVIGQLAAALALVGGLAYVPRLFTHEWPLAASAAIFVASAAPLIACGIYLSAFRWSFDAASTSRWFLVGIGAYLGVLWPAAARRRAISWRSIIAASALAVTIATVLTFLVFSLLAPIPRWGEIPSLLPVIWFMAVPATVSALIFIGIARLQQARQPRRLLRWAITVVLSAALAVSGIALLLQSTRVEPSSADSGTLEMLTDHNADFAALYVNMSEGGSWDDLDRFTSSPTVTADVHGTPGEKLRFVIFGTGYFARNYAPKQSPDWVHCRPSDSEVIASVEGVADKEGHLTYRDASGPRHVWWSEFGDRAVVKPPSATAYPPGTDGCMKPTKTEASAYVSVNAGGEQLRADSQIIQTFPNLQTPPTAISTDATAEKPAETHLSWSDTTDSAWPGPATTTPNFVIQTAVTRATAARQNFLAALLLGLALTLLVDAVRTFPPQPGGEHATRRPRSAATRASET